MHTSSLVLFATVAALLLLAGVAGAHYQLWKTRSQPPSDEEQRVIQFTRNNPDMPTYFINQVAAPIASKMFQCGMIP